LNGHLIFVILLKRYNIYTFVNSMQFPFLILNTKIIMMNAHISSPFNPVQANILLVESAPLREETREEAPAADRQTLRRAWTELSFCQ